MDDLSFCIVFGRGNDDRGVYFAKWLRVSRLFCWRIYPFWKSSPCSCGRSDAFVAPLCRCRTDLLLRTKALRRAPLEPQDGRVVNSLLVDFLDLRGVFLPFRDKLGLGVR